MGVGFRGSCHGSRSDSVEAAEAYVEVKRKIRWMYLPIFPGSYFQSFHESFP